MKHSTLRKTILTAAVLALGSGAAWAQDAQPSDARAGVPAADASAAPASGGSESDQPVTDTWITTKVKAELALTDGVKSGDISVTTTNGVVTLTGTQPSETAVKKAESVAQSIKGVTRVDSAGLKVDANAEPADEQDKSSGVGEAISDGWITAKVKAELATTEGVKSSDVSVDTNDGVVTLTGVLDSDVAVQKAEAAARSVKGVTDVDSSGLKARG